MAPYTEPPHLVFGVNFKNHDNRKMLQILRHYSRVPEDPGNRMALFQGLVSLKKDLDGNVSSISHVSSSPTAYEVHIFNPFSGPNRVLRLRFWGVSS